MYEALKQNFIKIYSVDFAFLFRHFLEKPLSVHLLHKHCEKAYKYLRKILKIFYYNLLYKY